MMSTATTYHLGGFEPSAPAQNKASEDDPVAGTHTEWDEAGNVTVQRPLTADETAALTPPPADQAVPVTADPATVAALAAHVEAITTDPATVKAALNAMLAALTANITT